MVRVAVKHQNEQNLGATFVDCPHVAPRVIVLTDPAKYGGKSVLGSHAPGSWVCGVFVVMTAFLKNSELESTQTFWGEWY